MPRVSAKLVVNVEYDSDETNVVEVCGAIEESLEHTNDCDIIREIHGFRVTIGRCSVLREE